MSIKKVPKESIKFTKIPDGSWVGSKIAEVLPATGETNMSCGIHEIFKSETIIENSPVDDVLYILEGELEIESEGVTHTYTAGDFAYLHADTRQKFTVRNRVKHIYITYPADWSGE